MSKISEFFGLNCNDDSLDFESAMSAQTCPYTQRVCVKMRKSNPNVKIGTCSVNYQNQNVIICPFRLLPYNQIFIDCLHLLTILSQRCKFRVDMWIISWYQPKIKRLKILLESNYRQWTRLELCGLNGNGS